VLPGSTDSPQVLGKSWFAPVNVGAFETSTILGDVAMASQINHASIISNALGIRSIDTYSHLTAGFGGEPTWYHGSLGSVQELSPTERARQQHQQERAERKHVRQMKRAHRRVERSYRINNLQSDVTHVRSTLIGQVKNLHQL